MALDMDFSKLQPHDVLDLAIFAEEEAQEQYESFSAIMETGHNREAAEFFRKMAEREKLHRDQIAERRQALYAKARPNLANRAVWGIEAPYDAKAESNLSLAAAFTIALDSEKRAHDYYAAALEQPLDATVSQLFENLRKAEIDHMRLLRTEQARHAAK
jgi:rubrerythrin